MRDLLVPAHLQIPFAVPSEATVSLWLNCPRLGPLAGRGGGIRTHDLFVPKQNPRPNSWASTCRAPRIPDVDVRRRASKIAAVVTQIDTRPARPGIPRADQRRRSTALCAVPIRAGVSALRPGVAGLRGSGAGRGWLPLRGRVV